MLKVDPDKYNDGFQFIGDTSQSLNKLFKASLSMILISVVFTIIGILIYCIKFRGDSDFNE